MNALLMASRLWQPIVEAPLWVVLLVKITAVLSAAWLAHLALGRTNPRWRVFLWRVTAVGLIVLPAVAWLLPSLPIHVQPPPVKERAAVAAPEVVAFDRVAPGRLRPELARNLPDEPAAILPFPASGRELGGEAGREAAKVEKGNAPPHALPLTLSRRERELSLTAIGSKSWLLSVWLVGMTVLAFRLFVGHYQIRRLVRRAKPAPAAIQTECNRVARAVGCRGRVTVLRSADVSAPLLCGLRRPLLLLPRRMCDGSYGRDLPGILAHELCHVRSHDVLWNVGLQLLSIGLWFHPLVWRMRKAHLGACELVCDAASASFVGDVTDYCRTLARVAVDACASLPVAGIAMARTSAIGRRLAALRRRVFHVPLRRRSVLGVGFAALLAVTVLGVLRFAFGAPPSESVASDKHEQVAAQVVGRVIDAKGAGIANASIAPRVQEGLVPRWQATTDRQGRYTMPPLGPGIQHELLTIAAPGFLSRELLSTASRPITEITLRKAASIAGLVRGADGKPLAHAPLALGIYSDFVGSNGAYLHAISDAEGRFTIKDIPPGVAVVYYPGPPPSRYDLELGRETKLLAPGQQWPPPIKDVYGSVVATLSDGQQKTNVVIDLSQSTCLVEGRVIGPDGKPLADATVSAKRYCQNLSFKNLTAELDGGSVQATSDATGQFKLDHLSPGRWAVSVWHPHYQRPGKIEFVAFPCGGRKLRRDLPVFERYEAQNVFPARVAIEHAETLKDLPQQRRFMFETPTMAQYRGLPRRYSFAELTVNSVPLARLDVEQLHLPEDATLEQIAKAAHVGELYYVAPDKLVTVNGTILAPCTLPPRQSPQESPRSRLSRLTRAQLAEQVRASLRETPAADGRRVTFQKGDWFIAVRNDGRAFLVDIEEEQSFNKDFVRLGTYYVGRLDLGAPAAEPPTKRAADTPPAKTVHGKVVDENGKPIAQADVWMMPAWNPAHHLAPTHATSDAEGRFSVPVSPFSDRDVKRLGWSYALGALWAYAPGHQLASAYSGNQIFGRDTSDVVIRLEPAAQTSLVILGPDGKPLADALVEPNFVTRQPVTGEPPAEVRSAAAARTDANGHAVLTAPPRGAFMSIRVVAEGLGTQTQRLTNLGLLPEDQPIRLRLAGKVAGHLTAAKPGSARGVRIVLSTSMPRPLAHGEGSSVTMGVADVISNEQGKFVVPVIAAGPLSVMAYVDDGLPVLPRLPDARNGALAVHPNETTSIEIPLEPAVSVHGCVRAKDTGKPIARRPLQIRYGTNATQEVLVLSDAEGKFVALVLAGKIELEVLVTSAPQYVPVGGPPRYEVPAGVRQFSLPAVELAPAKDSTKPAERGAQPGKKGGVAPPPVKASPPAAPVQTTSTQRPTRRDDAKTT